MIWTVWIWGWTMHCMVIILIGISLWADLLFIHACRSSTHVRVRDDRIQLYLPVLPGSSELGLGMVLVSLDSHKHIMIFPYDFWLLHGWRVWMMLTLLHLPALARFHTKTVCWWYVAWPVPFADLFFFFFFPRIFKRFHPNSFNSLNILNVHWFQRDSIGAALFVCVYIHQSQFLPVGPTLHVTDRDVRHCLMNIHVHDTHIWVPFAPRFELFSFQALYRGTVKHCG